MNLDIQHLGCRAFRQWNLDTDLSDSLAPTVAISGGSIVSRDAFHVLHGLGSLLLWLFLFDFFHRLWLLRDDLWLRDSKGLHLLLFLLILFELFNLWWLFLCLLGSLFLGFLISNPLVLGILLWREPFLMDLLVFAEVLVDLIWLRDSNSFTYHTLSNSRRESHLISWESFIVEISPSTKEAIDRVEQSMHSITCLLGDCKQ